jgi:hypothetical protein
MDQLLHEEQMGYHRRSCTHRTTDGPKVFHSFRHSFIDALRLAGVPGEINIALVGHTDPSVNGKYGAKDKAVRFRHRLAQAVASSDLCRGTGPFASNEPPGYTRPRTTTEHRGKPQGRRAVTNDDQRSQSIPMAATEASFAGLVAKTLSALGRGGAP